MGSGLGEKTWRVSANGYGVYFGGNKNVLELDSGDGCTSCEYNF